VTTAVDSQLERRSSHAQLAKKMADIFSSNAAGVEHAFSFLSGSHADNTSLDEQQAGRGWWYFCIFKKLATPAT
jgi:hypothetical protein